MIVVDGEGAECAETPGNLPGSFDRPETAAQTGLEGVRHHLLERRIGDQEIVDHAGRGGAGTAELQRRRRAVGLRKARIGGEVRGDFVGGADHRIEMLEMIAAVEQRLAPVSSDSLIWAMLKRAPAVTDNFVVTSKVSVANRPV